MFAAVTLAGMVGAIATHPWIVGAALLGGLAPGQTSIRVDSQHPLAATAGGYTVLPPDKVSSDLWSLIVDAAQGSSCGVSVQDLAAIASVETGGTFNPTLTNGSGHKGIGQFDDATWTAYGAGTCSARLTLCRPSHAICAPTATVAIASAAQPVRRLRRAELHQWQHCVCRAGRQGPAPASPIRSATGSRS
jgi:hypothetical protein